MKYQDIIKLKTGDFIRYDDLLNKIASFCFVECSEKTSSNNWALDFEDIEKTFYLKEGFITEEIASIIEKRIYELFGDMVAYIEIGLSYIDITLYDDFCCGYVFEDQALIVNEEENENED